MKQHNIVNIINFIRGVEPRDPAPDLMEPVVNQIRLLKEHNLPGTWLVQYDTLLDARFTDLLKSLGDEHEIGGWYELVQPQVERAGLVWRGRPGYPWDWHAHVGYPVGYTPAEREKLVDVFMEKFKAVFGKYPVTVGAWFIDAHTLGYMADRYGVRASCNCKEQWGTDGYTLWGGYYNQAYYPSRKNSFMPAQHEAEQIPVPTFRMLGSDPIYQYDAGIRPGFGGQPVITLEPVYSGESGGGGNLDWVRWFFDTIFHEPAITFGYTQVGQENSFGWPGMEKGLTFQVEELARRVAAGEVVVETLGDSAAWFASKYPVTPASGITATTDWKGEGHKSVWYNSRFYRTNLFWEDGFFRIRDLRIFDEEYKERYLTEVLPAPPSVYDTLPVVDGLLESDENVTAGIRIIDLDTKAEVRSGDPAVEESEDSFTVTWSLASGGEVKVVCAPSALSVKLPAKHALSVTQAKSALESIEPSCLHYTYEGFSYELSAEAGQFAESDSLLVLPDETGSIRLRFEK